MPHTSCCMVHSFDTVVPSFSCSSCRNCCVFSFLSAMLRPWKSRASSANWSNWRWFLTWENLWSPRGLESYLPKNPLCEEVMSTTIQKNADLRNQHAGLTNTCSKPKIGVMVHRNEAKKHTWTMTNARWITSSLIMIPQMMGIGKLTGLKYRRTHQNQLRRSKALLFGHPSGPGAQRHLGFRSRDWGAQRLSVGLAPFPVIIANEVLSRNPGI